MKKIIALFAAVVLLTTFGFVAVGKKLPSVGYVLVGPANDGGWSMRHSQGLQEHNQLKVISYQLQQIQMLSIKQQLRITQ
jgi:hypothetical protein